MKKLEIKKEDLIYNLNLIKNRLNGKADIIAVVKANGMGLDLIQFSKFLINNGITILSVSTPEDALMLRENGINEDILLMSEVYKDKELTALIENDIILTVGNLDEKEKIENLAVSLNKTVKVNIKIDTGFSRYGFLFNDENIFEVVKSTENIDVIGCFTHFSKPIDEKWTRMQFSRFKMLIPKIKEINSNIKFHCCGSTAFLKYEEMWLDYVRLGSCIQGRVLENRLGLKVIGKLKTEIITIKNIKKGYNISYSNEYKAPKDMKIAVIGIRLY